MFQTLTGSLAILFAVVGIIFVFALFMTAVLRWLFLTDVEMAETTTVFEASSEYHLRKAA
jgi:type IV secretory pathway VirB2 component (pilin)